MNVWKLTHQCVGGARHCIKLYDVCSILLIQLLAVTIEEKPWSTLCSILTHHEDRFGWFRDDQSNRNVALRYCKVCGVVQASRKVAFGCAPNNGVAPIQGGDYCFKRFRRPQVIHTRMLFRNCQILVQDDAEMNTAVNQVRCQRTRRFFHSRKQLGSSIKTNCSTCRAPVTYRELRAGSLNSRSTTDDSFVPLSNFIMNDLSADWH
mmetsp:Transcript_24851/g.41140  ORF Transcript_24851/g.41140 Transcript_24851/m.41140 type:complete len:206 (-) Transcript_24851:8-625(-)